ncbi:MAG: ABC transporter permease subunit [Acidimicrobiales bacterium]
MAATGTAVARRSAGPARSLGLGVLFLDALRSEWTKLRSLRSTYWTLLVAVAATIGISAAICAAHVSQDGRLGPGERAGLDPAFLSISGVFLAQLAVGVLGVLVISSEHTTGMIRTTITAFPQRRMLLWAKAGVFSAVTLVVGLVSTFVGFFVGQAILSGQSMQTSLGHPGVLRVVVGGALYLLVVGLLGLGLGAVFRRTAGAIAVLFGLLLVLPALASALPSPWNQDVMEYLPNSAGSALLHTAHQAGSLGPWVGFAVFCGYAAAALVGGTWLIHRRDV